MKPVICEKNISARKIAHSFSGGKSKSMLLVKIPIYDLSKDGVTK